ncbi:hypothetical protein A2311_01375 [candidate division WOR-1 bacterium RIFOXYB2_FULL_48_7]|uniref:Organic solvent tolerance-like N-terminal domain-containing protein n=1 Tax=candidate division WOR-1 bacterium RIFOXYB2_FULL_48_7 TaxID=1802583 RepID=A0A1F4TUH3_UNCSA|nr:MAG: hypothetical protein A2311_01375 [candidate division WOR-1 bacterium RIFOXYB2_FULL_48_7]
MNLSRLILSLAFIFLAGIFFWALFVPKDDMSQRIYKTIQEQTQHSDLFFKQVAFEEISNGLKYWQLQAATGAVNKSTGLATLQDSTGTFFKLGKPVLLFSAPAALWDMKKKEIYLDKPTGYDVTLANRIQQLTKQAATNRTSLFSLPENFRAGASYWFQAKNLSWKLSDQQLLCSGGIVLNKGEVSGYADQLRSDVGLENIRLEGSPRLVMQRGQNAPITLEAESFLINSRQGLFTAQGNPVVSWLEARITAGQAIYHQADKRLTFKDHVTINYKDISASGDTADYYTLQQKIVLSGQAQAQQGDNHLTGNKIMVLLKENKISVLGKSRVIISEEELTP